MVFMRSLIYSENNKTVLWAVQHARLISAVTVLKKPAVI